MDKTQGENNKGLVESIHVHGIWSAEDGYEVTYSWVMP